MLCVLILTALSVQCIEVTVSLFVTALWMLVSRSFLITVVVCVVVKCVFGLSLSS